VIVPERIGDSLVRKNVIVPEGIGIH